MSHGYKLSRLLAQRESCTITPSYVYNRVWAVRKSVTEEAEYLATIASMREYFEKRGLAITEEADAVVEAMASKVKPELAYRMTAWTHRYERAHNQARLYVNDETGYAVFLEANAAEVLQLEVVYGPAPDGGRVVYGPAQDGRQLPDSAFDLRYIVASPVVDKPAGPPDILIAPMYVRSKSFEQIARVPYVAEALKERRRA